MTDQAKYGNPGLSEELQEPYTEIPADPESFVRWAATLDRSHPYKYELSNGRVRRMMINVSRAHWRICGNIVGEMRSGIDSTRYEASPAEFGVMSPQSVRFPDVLVERLSADLNEYASSCPVLIVEVLSPSTAGLDFTEKLQEYTAIESLGTYLICSQDEPRAWIWSRREDDSWPRLPEEIAGREASIRIPGLGTELAMAAVFRGIPDAPRC